MSRRIVVLTEGHSDPHSAKTGCSVIRYRREEVVGVLDRTRTGQDVQSVLGTGEGLLFSAQLSDVPDADTLLIGIAPTGGKIPTTWRTVISEAIGRGMTVVSGLHEFIGDDPEFAAQARDAGVEIHDLRKNDFREIARRVPLSDSCARVLTVGHDCAVGKMVTAIEICEVLKRRGRAAKFVPTGQTGIMIEGDGLPIDCITADFVSGAAEQLVVEQQHQEFLLIEGQGSLVHPSYSSVTLGLLHGCVPHGLILCYEVGRTTVTGIPHMAIPPLEEIKQINEMMASVMQPCSVIGISMNSRLIDDQQAEEERQRIRQQFGLPVVDVFRHGADELADAVVELGDKLKKQNS